MEFNFADTNPIGDGHYPQQQYAAPLEIPQHLRSRWEIERAINTAGGIEDTRSPKAGGGLTPVYGYPYENGVGQSDLSALDPPAPPHTIEEIRDAVSQSVYDARLAMEAYEREHIPVIYPPDPGESQEWMIDQARNPYDQVP